MVRDKAQGSLDAEIASKLDEGFSMQFNFLQYRNPKVVLSEIVALNDVVTYNFLAGGAYGGAAFKFYRRFVCQRECLPDASG